MPNKKEPLSLIAVKTLLAVIIFTGVGTIIVGGAWLVGKQGKVLNNEPVKVVDCYSDKNCKTLKCPHRNELGCTSVASVIRRCVDNKCVCKCGYPDYDLPKPFSGKEIEYKGKTYIKTDEKYSKYIADKFRVELEDGTSIYFFNNSVYTLYAADPNHGSESYIYYKWIEKKMTSEVTVTTDKTEYEQGETIKITVRNNLDKSIWYKDWEGDEFGCGSSLSVMGKENGNYKNFFSLGIAECKSLIITTELDSEKVFYLTTEALKNASEIFGVKFPTNYKLKFDYCLDKNCIKRAVTYSNEFAIKKNETADWKTYNSKLSNLYLYSELKNPFTFKYPQNWLVSETKSGIEIYSKQFKVEIIPFWNDKDNRKIKDWCKDLINSHYGDFKPEIFTEEYMVVSGINSYSIDYEYKEDKRYNVREICIPISNAKKMTIVGNSPKDLEFLSVYNQILSTFKFTEK